MPSIAMEYVLLILGSLMSILLLINAFFTRKTLEQIHAVSLQLAVLISKHDVTEERSKFNALEISKIRDRLHKIEGDNRIALQVIKDMTK